MVVKIWLKRVRQSVTQAGKRHECVDWVSHYTDNFLTRKRGYFWLLSRVMTFDTPNTIILNTLTHKTLNL